MSEHQTISQDKIVEVLKTVFDPEIPVNIYELGLVYDIRIEDGNKIKVAMTLTSPNCPEAQSLPMTAQKKLAQIPGATEAKVDVVWDPPWNPNMMSEAAKLQLGFM